MPEAVAFENAVVSLLRGAGPALGPELRARLTALGIDPGRLQPAYPIRTWLAAVSAVGDALAPGEPPAKARFLVGQRFMEGYESTTMGKAIFAMGRLLGTERMFARFTRNARTTNNYTESSLKVLAPGEAEMVSRVGAEFLAQALPLPSDVIPHFTHGVLSAMHRGTGATRGGVELVAFDEPTRCATYRVTW